MGASMQEPRNDTGPTPLPARDERILYVLAPGLYYITSPRYPYLYPNFVDKRWYLFGAQGQTITIGCSDFDVEYHHYCRYDFLRINGVKYCGSDVVEDVTSPELRIQFSTDYSVRRRGFYCLITVPSVDGSPDPDGHYADRPDR
ncbi:Adhesion G-protein coupled receptor G6 [Amphibalanus amphitrite]|uniref:Adhesion G-protein coupled receptor G6 n=1 Tax=Amphibalanus amphitrite TaxID=1232801 RepID=A0A6A4V1P6_AMPAM|nr:Adhesion G-protein coupled receptor G6 [Amphibalanus amphitrite]